MSLQSIITYKINVILYLKQFTDFLQSAWAVLQLHTKGAQYVNYHLLLSIMT